MRAAVLLVPCLLLLVGCGVGKKAAAVDRGEARHERDASHAPATCIRPSSASTTRPSEPLAGYVFVGQKGGKDRPSGTVIADNRGRIVWYHEVPSGLEATDFRAQTYRGKPVLTWWQGTISQGRDRARELRRVRRVVQARSRP